jgi:hypothetical protein
MRKIIILGAVILILGVAAAAAAQTADEHLKKGDEYYAQLNDAKALEEYLAAVEQLTAGQEVREVIVG